MIFKKVRNPIKSSGKSVRIQRLTDYIREPIQRDEREGGEKCVYSGSRGFISEKFRTQQAEMLALSQESSRSSDTINHYTLSWREGEPLPTPKQVEEAVSLMLDQMGLTEHQAIYGLHVDTNNAHLHIAVNRVHPETERVIEINGGYDIEAGHKAIARIEHAQGWLSERNALYTVNEHGEVVRRARARDDRDGKEPSAARKDMEIRTGEKSAERIAAEAGWPLIRDATSWQNLHKSLAAEGMRYERKGSGAILWVGDTPVKASSAHKQASLAHLEKRLGPLEAPDRPLKIADRSKEQLARAETLSWKDYTADRIAYRKDRQMAQEALSERHKGQWAEMKDAQAKWREEVYSQSWKGRGAELNATRSIMAFKRVQETDALKKQQQAERKAFRAEYPSKFPSYEQYLQGRDPDLIEQYRYEPLAMPAKSQEDQKSEIVSGGIAGYTPQVQKDGKVRYYDSKGKLAVEDRGKEMVLRGWKDKENLLIGMQMSQAKWGTFKIQGGKDFKAQAMWLSAQNNLRLDCTGKPKEQAQYLKLQELNAALKSETKAISQESQDIANIERLAEIARQKADKIPDWKREEKIKAEALASRVEEYAQTERIDAKVSIGEQQQRLNEVEALRPRDRLKQADALNLQATQAATEIEKRNAARGKDIAQFREELGLDRPAQTLEKSPIAAHQEAALPRSAEDREVEASPRSIDWSLTEDEKAQARKVAERLETKEERKSKLIADMKQRQEKEREQDRGRGGWSR